MKRKKRNVSIIYVGITLVVSTVVWICVLVALLVCEPFMSMIGIWPEGLKEGKEI